MNVIKIASFSDNGTGGNPAGVVISAELPPESEMRQIAADVGFSETVFAKMQDSPKNWRVRYFSPESEVPFCGHATIALGAALAEKHGNGNYHLQLNHTEISVQGTADNNQYFATLQSPTTHSNALSDKELSITLNLFGYKQNQLSNEIIPAHIYAGANHYVLALKDKEALSSMTYDLNAGRDFMNQRELITVMFVFAESNQVFHVRNAFASGGVFEDPATGAAAAAFTGYLRDINWPANGKFTLIQGEDMGSRSVITTEFNDEPVSSIKVSGAIRYLK